MPNLGYITTLFSTSVQSVFNVTEFHSSTKGQETSCIEKIYLSVPDKPTSKLHILLYLFFYCTVTPCHIPQPYSRALWQYDFYSATFNYNYSNVHIFIYSSI